MITDYSSLPPPLVKEELDFETELQSNKDKLKELEPTWNADVESDTAVKLLEVNAYNSVNERQRVNSAATSVMLPWAKGEDLDGLAANFNLERETIQEADDTVSPPLEEIKESDESLFQRCLLAWSKLTNAGTPSSYEAHARDAHPKVKDAKGKRIKGGTTVTYVLSHDGDGTPTEEILTAVRTHLSKENIRQLCSDNTVEAATIQNYTITAILEIPESSLEAGVINQALINVQAYVDKVHHLESLVSESALNAALHIEGVVDVNLGNFANITTDESTAPYCTKITISRKVQT